MNMKTEMDGKLMGMDVAMGKVATSVSRILKVLTLMTYKISFVMKNNNSLNEIIFCQLKILKILSIIVVNLFLKIL